MEEIGGDGEQIMKINWCLMTIPWHGRDFANEMWG